MCNEDMKLLAIAVGNQCSPVRVLTTWLLSVAAMLFGSWAMIDATGLYPKKAEKSDSVGESDVK